MDFTLPLYPEQNREGRQGGKGWGGGCKGDLWPSNLHFEQGHCFSPTCRMSKCLFFFFFFQRNSMDSLYQILFSSVTLQHFPQTLTTHACQAWSHHKDLTVNGNFLPLQHIHPWKLLGTHAIICTHARPISHLIVATRLSDVSRYCITHWLHPCGIIR